MSIELMGLILLFIGSLFLFISVLMNSKEKPKQREFHFASNIDSSKRNVFKESPKISDNRADFAFPNMDLLFKNKSSVEKNISEENSPHTEPDSIPKVKVNVYNENPSFFTEKAYLYFDYNKNNAYTGEEVNFTLNDITSIRRFGLGSLSYRGVSFFLEYENGKHVFNVHELEHIAFYLNCIALVQRGSSPTALLFMNDTQPLRKVIETFQLKENF